MSVPAPGEGRWVHLPGNGRGPWQPPLTGRIRVGLLRLVKPLLIVGFALFGVAFAAHELPQLFSFTTTHVAPPATTPTPKAAP